MLAEPEDGDDVGMVQPCRGLALHLIRIAAWRRAASAGEDLKATGRPRETCSASRRPPCPRGRSPGRCENRGNGRRTPGLGSARSSRGSRALSSRAIAGRISRMSSARCG